MFGFGKKKIDDRLHGMIGVEIAMFRRWVETNKNLYLTLDELTEIAKRVLNREKLKCSDGELKLLALSAFTHEEDGIDKLRKKFKFDLQAVKFMESINYSLPVRR